MMCSKLCLLFLVVLMPMICHWVHGVGVDVEYGFNDSSAWVEIREHDRDQVKRFEGLEIMPHIFAPAGKDATKVFVTNHLKSLKMSRKKLAPMSSTYGRKLERGWITLTRLAEAEVTISLVQGRNVSTIAADRGDGAGRALGSNATYSLTRDNWEGIHASCGAMKLITDEEEGGDRVGRDGDLFSTKVRPVRHRAKNLEGGLQVEEKRHGRGLRAKRWTDCYVGEDTPRFLETGVVIDLSFYRFYDSDMEKAIKAMEVIVANANMIYYYQLNIFIRVRQVLVIVDAQGMNTEQGSVGWTFTRMPSPSSGVCEDMDILTALEGMTTFSRELSAHTLRSDGNMEEYEDRLEVSSLAHWHMLTNCFPSDCGKERCTVGIAWSLDVPRPAGSQRIGTICMVNEGINVAVTSKSTSTWITFAHELGHNFGLAHSFEEGRGTTGGIMDYGDGKYLGEYQFNEKYRRDELCNELNLMLWNKVCDVQANANPTSSPTKVQLLPTFSSESSCSSASDYELCPFGVCLGGECVLPKSILSANVTEYEFSVADFGMPISAYDDPVEGGLVVADPRNDCTTLQDVDGKIVLFESSELCAPYDQAFNAMQRGATAVLVMGSRYSEGPPELDSGLEGSSLFQMTENPIRIPVLSISQSTGLDMVSRGQVSRPYSLKVHIGRQEFATTAANLSSYRPRDPLTKFALGLGILIGIFAAALGIKAAIYSPRLEPRTIPAIWRQPSTPMVNGLRS